jgi:peptidylprolyl isomerase
VKQLFFALAGLLFSAALAWAQMPKGKPDPANTLVLEIKGGKVLIELRPDLAPRHVERVKQLAREGFYNGLKFHRVIDGFMAQTGDPKGDGTGGSKYGNLPAEFTSTPYVRGTVGAARTTDPNSANSQFFIVFRDTPHLNGQYTVWGRVIEGMEIVDRIKKGEPGSGRVSQPDIIEKAYLLGEAR